MVALSAKAIIAKHNKAIAQDIPEHIARKKGLQQPGRSPTYERVVVEPVLVAVDEKGETLPKVPEYKVKTLKFMCRGRNKAAYAVKCNNRHEESSVTRFVQNTPNFKFLMSVDFNHFRSDVYKVDYKQWLTLACHKPQAKA